MVPARRTPGNQGSALPAPPILRHRHHSKAFGIKSVYENRMVCNERTRLLDEYAAATSAYRTAFAKVRPAKEAVWTVGSSLDVKSSTGNMRQSTSGPAASQNPTRLLRIHPRRDNCVGWIFKNVRISFSPYAVLSTPGRTAGPRLVLAHATRGPAGVVGGACDPANFSGVKGP
jgi:hypothetical protein